MASIMFGKDGHIKTHQVKLDRNRIDLSDSDVARRWSKHFGKSVEEITAAIAKVGENAQSVQKELGCDPSVSLTD